MHATLLRPLAVLAACFSLLACTTASGPGNPATGAREPFSSQTPAGETQRRARVHTELGSLYLSDGRLAVALEEARLALKIDPNFAPAYNLLGLTHMLLNETRLADENFAQALRYAPGDPEIFNNYGWFLCQTNREKQSMEYFLAAARNPLYPTPAKSYANAGICAIRLKDDKAAEEYLARAIKLDPESVMGMYWLADLFYRTGRAAEARQWMQELERRMELPAEATWLALRIERKLGNREGEARQIARLRRVFPASPEAKKMQQGDFE